MMQTVEKAIERTRARAKKDLEAIDFPRSDLIVAMEEEMEERKLQERGVK